MPLYRLPKEPYFPDPNLAEPDGLLAIGGDLSPERLLNAYASGIFPWFNEGDPILWWSPNPRCVFIPGEMKISRSMGKFLKKHQYRVTFDTCFERVMDMCRKLREDRTWITDDMLSAYGTLHKLGYAHSVETWHEDKLVGGLYGVSLGKSFFGESMFSTMDNASKTALYTLAEYLHKRGFHMIDAQVHSDHLASLGAQNLPRIQFLNLLKASLEHPTQVGKWELL
jgi:leucyl/phenylalanyl-tRNA---protein transferase